MSTNNKDFTVQCIVVRAIYDLFYKKKVSKGSNLLFGYSQHENEEFPTLVVSLYDKDQLKTYVNDKSITHFGMVGSVLFPRDNIPKDLLNAYNKGQILLEHVSYEYINQTIVVNTIDKDHLEDICTICVDFDHETSTFSENFKYRFNRYNCKEDRY